MLGVSCQTTRAAANASSSTSQPLKAAKKYRSDDDSDKQIVRCKRKLSFLAMKTSSSSTKQHPGERVTSTSGDHPIYADLHSPAVTSRRRPPDIVARRNERERKRVSLINRTFETLRDQLPVSSWGHRHIGKVSKVETLRAAIEYIRTLQDLLATTSGDDDEGLDDVGGTDGLADDVDCDVDALTRHDAAMCSAERLGMLSSAVLPTDGGLFVPTLDFRLPTDGEEMYCRRRVDTFSVHPLSVDGSTMQSTRNDDVEIRLVQHLVMQQQQHRERRMQVLSATQRLAQLTAGIEHPTDTLRKVSSGDYVQPPLDINSNLCVDDWRQLVDDRDDEFPSSTSSASMGQAGDSVDASDSAEFPSAVEEQRRQNRFGSSSAGSVLIAELEQYLLADHGDSDSNQGGGAKNMQSVV